MCLCLPLGLERLGSYSEYSRDSRFKLSDSSIDWCLTIELKYYYYIICCVPWNARLIKMFSFLMKYILAINIFTLNIQHFMLNGRYFTFRRKCLVHFMNKNNFVRKFWKSGKWYCNWYAIRHDSTHSCPQSIE